MGLDYTIRFCEQFKLNPQEYVDFHVTSLPFSVRIMNRLQSNQIYSVADLLQKAPGDLLQISGFGAGCLDEIENYLSSLQDTNSIQIEHHPTKSRIFLTTFVLKNVDKLLHGDFSCLAENTLSEQDVKEIQMILGAYKCIGAELVHECISNPEYIRNIVEGVNSFCYNEDQLTQLKSLINKIPSHRRENKAYGYIYAYTNDSEKRTILLSQYSSEDACLCNLHGNNLTSTPTLILVRKFLNWCAFDLFEDVKTLINSVANNTRLYSIIEMRARKYTLEQIGQKYQLTRERIRQLEKKAFKVFALQQSRIKIVAKISADKNGDSLITSADIERYSGNNSVELLYLLRNYTSSTYTYDKQLDIFIVGDDTLHDRLFSFVDALPEMFSAKSLSEYLEVAIDEYELPEITVRNAIAEDYKLTGDVYHRCRLSLANIYTSILQDYYPAGIKAHDPSVIRRFREIVHSIYGEVKLPANDRALTARITDICVLCDKGTYKLKQKQYIPKTLSKRIYDYIITSDLDIFMTNTLFNVFEVDLRKAGVHNKYYLQGILHELYGDRLVFTRDYVSKGGGATSIYSSVVDFIQKSPYPVNKKQILEKFPGLPDVVLTFSVSNPNILNYYGEYLHTSKLCISPDEERYLNAVIKRIVSDNDSHHIKDFYAVVNSEKPEILTRNGALYPFSAFSILEYLFRDSYQFLRPYIAMPGIDIGKPAERLHDLLYALDEFTFDDISEFSKDNHFNIQSQLEFVNSCNDRFLIADRSTIKTIDKIGVTETIATSIEHIIANEINTTTPICQLTCWADFPALNVPWTEWLVYSVLHKWGTLLTVAPSSNQFRLSTPLVAPIGQMDVSPFADAYKKTEQISVLNVADNLDDIDEILAEMYGDKILEDELWD